MPNNHIDNVFFHKATTLLASPNVKEGLLLFYDLLLETFPIEGMIIHYYPPSKFLPQLYFIKKNEMKFIGRVIPFNREQAMFLRAFSMVGGVNNISESQNSITAASNDLNIQDILEFKQRAHLICCLNVGNAAIGLLRLIGNEKNCFTPDHERMLNMLNTPLGFSLTRLFQLEEVQTFLLNNSFLNQLPMDTGKLSSGALVGTSSAITDMLETINKLKGTEAPVLIVGETGTGKELVADAIQAASKRKNKPFIKVNCGAIPESLIDSTLFGHEKGAFTGAYNSMPGKFEQANGGTLFLDELGELSLSAQVRLLRTLQNHVVERIGSTQSISVDVRIIAATNRNIKEMLLERSFREDLYHRLNVFVIFVPPLRDRAQDILPLVEHFIENTTKKLRLPPVSGIDPLSSERLLEYSWPGNVRELENLIERTLILDYDNSLKPDRYLNSESETKKSISSNDFDIQMYVQKIVREQLENCDYIHKTTPIENKQREWEPEFLENIVRDHILQTLQFCNGLIHGKRGAAERLGMNSDTLRKKIKRMGLDTFLPK